MVRFRFAFFCGFLVLAGAGAAFWGYLVVNHGVASEADERQTALPTSSPSVPTPANKPLPPINPVSPHLPPLIGAVAPFPHFHVVVLPKGFEAKALNNKGDVAGAWNTGKETTRGFGSRAVTRAAIWSKNHLRLLPSEGWPLCCAYSINDKGVAGGFMGEPPSYSPIDNGSEDAVLWYTDGKTKHLPHTEHLGQMGITGLNRDEAVVGWAHPMSDHDQVFVSYGSGFFAGNQSFVLLSDVAHAINERSEVVGAMNNQIALWQGEKRLLLGSGEAFALNNRGWIVGAQNIGGVSENADPPWKLRRAFLYRNHVLLDLGVLPGGDTMSQARSVNDRGQIVGLSTHSDDIYFERGRPFLWQNNTMVDLNQLVPHKPGMKIWDAKAINNQGQIVGTGTFNGKERSFLLTPLR